MMESVFQIPLHLQYIPVYNAMFFLGYLCPQMHLLFYIDVDVELSKKN